MQGTGGDELPAGQDYLWECALGLHGEYAAWLYDDVLPDGPVGGFGHLAWCAGRIRFWLAEYERLGYGRGPWDTRTAAQREQDAEQARGELYGR